MSLVQQYSDKWPSKWVRWRRYSASQGWQVKHFLNFKPWADHYSCLTNSYEIHQQTHLIWWYSALQSDHVLCPLSSINSCIQIEMLEVGKHAYMFSHSMRRILLLVPRASWHGTPGNKKALRRALHRMISCSIVWHGIQECHKSESGQLWGP